MKAQIYVNRHKIAANKKATKETGMLVDEPAISVNTYKGTIYGKQIEFTQGCKLIQDAKNARCSGATIWIEVDDFESLIIDGTKANRCIREENWIMIKNQELAETAIREARKTIDYNTVEYPLEYFIDKISDKELKKDLHWDTLQQSYFIESLLLGLPVINAVIYDDLELKFIDGKQRLYTAINFVKGNLILANLKTLTALNGFSFNDLVPSRQRKFKRISLRAIAVNPQSDLSVWKEYA